MFKQDEFMTPSNRWGALLGALPFLAYGISNMIGVAELFKDPWGRNAEMAVYVLVLAGFLVGWTRGFPLWTYSYLGWSIILAWSNTNISYYGVHWDYQIWIPFGITILLALLWTRSLDPVKNFFRDIWADWSRLSLTMYTFIGLMFLIYDSNHHPYLLVFIWTSALIIAAGAWFFLRSSNLKSRSLSLVIACGLAWAGNRVLAWIISSIWGVTWDYHAYYGLPHIVKPWYTTVRIGLSILSFYGVFLFWPTIIQVIRERIRPRGVG